MNKILKNWYWYIVLLFLIFAAAVLGICGQNSYIAVHDNLDLFAAQYKMLKNTGTFFAHGAQVPYLGGINRDNLPSEWALSTLLYVIFPMYTAYVLNYLLKVVIAVGSFYLLAKEIYEKREVSTFWKPLAVLCGLAYGMLNVFPAFGIPFASIPLVIYILLKIQRAEDIKKALPWYAALFAYPFVSYFSYFGLFLCGYLLLAFIIVSVVQKKVNTRLLTAIPVLSVGYVIFEYRLFGVMLFGSEETIRTTMAGTDFTFGEVMREVWDVFRHSIFHAESLQHKLVLHICALFFICLNGCYILKKKWKTAATEPFNWMMVGIFFNAFIYGIYDFAPVRSLVETICPPLAGWQFNRTLFFNPFLWYAALFVVLERMVRLWENGRLCEKVRPREKSEAKAGGTPEKGSTTKEPLIKKYAMHGFAVAVVGMAMLFILLTDTRYNDLFHTCYNQALKIVKHKEPDSMNYREFYGEELFAEAMKDLHYDGEWAVAYGFHPAVLEYNNIKTLDGYLGFYAQSYKEAFRKIIAPALDRVEASRIYYDDWGARAYLYSGTDVSTVSEFKSFALTDYDLYIDPDAFHALGGTYIFSRFQLTNEEALGMTKVGEYENETIPYKLYVYR